ncbi:M48 family metallopeptidase [Microbacterium sp. MYb64]|uniref:M48 family metallopeptidase n=1 Tax=Microbacterium sp. MYb64 TaxID=1848691 RepID=UPI0015E2FEED|nr:SprT family zinc-dependent metalloprotease [Microbacterium sp. MYb64]
MTVAYGTQLVSAEVRWAARKTLDITITPDGAVVVTAPIDADLLQIRSQIRARARWILEQQRYFAQFRPRTPARRWLPDETHRYLGRQYRLRIADTTATEPHVRPTRGFLLIDGIDFDDSAGMERVVQSWYRARAREIIDQRLPVCAELFDPPLWPTAVTVRSMSSRWASMSPSGRLTVNPDLIRAPTDAIDYVLAHELAHLLVPDHSARFIALLTRVMPDHPRRKQRLERATA